MRICASLYNIYFALSDHPNGGAKILLFFELTKKKCKKVYPMDCFFDSAYHLSCPCDSCDSTGTGRYSLFMMMRVPAAEEAWPMAPCMLEYVG